MASKAKEICNREARGIPYTTIIAYVFDKGMSNLEKLTDEQINRAKGNRINRAKGNRLLTADFVQALARAGRELSRNCSMSEIVELIKSDWCNVGEVYDPDRDQFVKDLSEEEDYYEEEYE